MTNRSILDITHGVSIERPEPVPPTPVDYGIYHSPSLGLISISEDGTNWITITDKNLGATQVWNDGDELSEANCGKFYQRGNNYGFPLEGEISITSTQVDASNYGPYYDDGVFIESNLDWSSVQNDNLWGDTTDTLIARQGPCPTGYHIPTKDEHVALVDTMTALGINTSNGICMKTYLKMPFVGYRSHSSADITNQDTYAFYWSSTVFGAYDAYNLYFSSSGFNTQNEARRSSGLSVRPFKNESVIPSSSWTTLYQGIGNAGIFHNPTDGIISISSDGINWITIADKNLGATYVYEDGDQLTEGNCGGYFQRGNNYMFPFNGEVTTSSTQVNATNYGPYYYHNEFKIGYDPWTSVKNPNLWGDITNTNKARRGPCDEGFHVPSNGELGELRTIMGYLGIRQNANVYLKLPYAGYRYYINGQNETKGFYAKIPCTMMHGINSVFGAIFNSDFYDWTDIQLSEGVSIRPFKNEPVIPDNTRTKLY